MKKTGEHNGNAGADRAFILVAMQMIKIKIIISLTLAVISISKQCAKCPKKNTKNVEIVVACSFSRFQLRPEKLKMRQKKIL